MARTKKKYEIITERKVGGLHPDSGAIKKSTYTTYSDSEEGARASIRFKLQGKKRQETIVSVMEATDGKEDNVETAEGTRGDDVNSDRVAPGKATKKNKGKKEKGNDKSEAPTSDGKEGEDWGKNF